MKEAPKLYKTTALALSSYSLRKFGLEIVIGLFSELFW